MPPLKGIDRGLNGEALKALEESGHGRRLAVVDPSYPIPEWAQVIEYQGKTSADALRGILRLVGAEDDTVIAMYPDSDGGSSAHPDLEAVHQFDNVAHDFSEGDCGEGQADVGILTVCRTDELEVVREGGSMGPQPRSLGFYSIANNQKENTIFFRTRDELPYACATFVIDHAQIGKAL